MNYNGNYIITLDESYKFEYGRRQGIFHIQKKLVFFINVIFISNY